MLLEYMTENLYSMGWYTVRLCVLLAVVVILGYGLVDAITTGLIFAAVSGGKVSSIMGIVRYENY